jgi:two-component system, NarL family, nitrate/nitrite response regulator NarL
MRKIAIAVVDDHPLLTAGIVSHVESRSGFSLVATGTSAADIHKISKGQRADVLIVDLSMPGDVFGAISAAIRAAPKMRIVVFTASTNTDETIRSLDSGASGYVLKGSSADELFTAVEAAFKGEIFITPSFAPKVISALQVNNRTKDLAQRQKLGVREDQILKLLLHGKKNREIAECLKLSEKTVKGYMTVLMQKLHARNRLEVVIAAQKLDPASFVPERMQQY